MFVLKLFMISVLLTSGWSIKTIPSWFKLGVASSSYQIEGAWNVSDKRDSVLDHFMHGPFTSNTPEAIVNGENGDVACDSYHNWERDVEMLAELGVDFYRFSINWPRLLPESFSNYISIDGMNYYDRLIDALLAKGIEPVVTLYHWELPQKLQDFGGWVNPAIVDFYTDYARVVFTLYGDRVKTWLTFNEPVMNCDATLSTGWMPPGYVETSHAPFLCNKHQLLAHARAWRLYDEEFKWKFGGKVSIANHLLWLEPYSEKDKELTDLVMDYVDGRYVHPIYSKEGGWPPAIEKKMMEISLKQGYQENRLPAFTKEEVELIRGTYDFFGLNHYTSRLVRAKRPHETIGPFFYDGIRDLDAVLEMDPNWPTQYDNRIPVNPPALRTELAWVKRTYGDMEVFISETGFTTSGAMEDIDRCQFIRDHLEQVMLSIQEDGVNVTGFTYWSLMDSFEWLSGYDLKFGLYSVDMTSPRRHRTPRASAIYMAELTHSRKLLPIT